MVRSNVRRLLAPARDRATDRASAPAADVRRVRGARRTPRHGDRPARSPANAAPVATRPGASPQTRRPDARPRGDPGTGIAARRRTARTRASSSWMPNGFGKVIVGADFKAGHPIELRSLCREHDDRDGPVGAQPPADAEAVLARHHDVEDDQIDARRAHRLRHRSSILRNGNAKSVVGQEAREKAAQFLVVIDDQDVL